MPEESQGKYWEIFRGVPTNWQMNEGLLDSRDVSPAKDNGVIFRANNFCKAKDKKREAEKRSLRYQSYQGDKYATTDFTRGRVDVGPLCADHRRLCMLCWAARASDVLITLRLLN